jgi:hypothetical protein
LLKVSHLQEEMISAKPALRFASGEHAGAATRRVLEMR